MIWLAPAIAATAALVGRIADQRRQKKANAELARTQASANEAYQNQQNQYNSPQAQMARFKAAGLNPNLIYSQGNPGNQSSQLSYPSIQPTDYGGTFDSIASDFFSTQMQQTQRDAVETKTAKTLTEIDINRVEKEVLERNPLLDDEYLKALVDNMVLSAGNKAAQLKNQGISNEILQASGGHMVNKLFKELAILEDKHNLNDADLKIKAQILRSQTFLADLNEIQKQWMSDAEITPQHIYQFITALLLKFAR